MKTDLLSELEYGNPLRLFQTGLLPTELAQAYKRQHGYDPLKSCWVFSELRMLRIFAWQIFLFGSMLGLGVWQTAYQAHKAGMLLQLDFLHHVVFLVSGIIAGLVLLISRKYYEKSESRMRQFRWDCQTFVQAFGNSVSQISNKEGVASFVVERMTQTARAVLVGEASNMGALRIEPHRLKLEEQSIAANIFGLGQSWTIYFDEVKKFFNPYEYFAWEI